MSWATVLFVVAVLLCTAALVCYSVDDDMERAGNRLTLLAVFCLVLGFGIGVSS